MNPTTESGFCHNYLQLTTAPCYGRSHSQEPFRRDTGGRSQNSMQHDYVKILSAACQGGKFRLKFVTFDPIISEPNHPCEKFPRENVLQFFQFTNDFRGWRLKITVPYSTTGLM